MKALTLRLLASAVVLFATSSQAAIVIPRTDGSDGALVISSNTVIDLSLASTNVWDANNSARSGTGVYDSNKWAVVFKYTSVMIASNATVTFKNHPSRAPVVWLVSGDVTIDGVLSLDGQWSVGAPLLSEPGPGGFRGGMGYYGPLVREGAGFGPGGGSLRPRLSAGSYGGPGEGDADEMVYGNPSLITLIGGSGGGGAQGSAPSGGAGGGAILIACANSLAINGELRANGGLGSESGGSGGGIRLVSHVLAGAGKLTAIGNASGTTWDGGVGRIRIERVVNSSTIMPVPDPSVVELMDGATAPLWPPDDAPQVRIVSIGGINAPADPRAEFGTIGADVVLPQVSSTDVVIETRNVEPNSVVTVRLTPRSNGNYTETIAANPVQISSNPLILHWTATIPVEVGYAAAQVKVVRP